MSATWEVVRTDAEQPWHARLIANGRVLMTSETYARMVGAERAILATVRAHDIGPARLVWNVEGVEKVMVGEDGAVLGWAPVVRFCDERGQR